MSIIKKFIKIVIPPPVRELINLFIQIRMNKKSKEVRKQKNRIKIEELMKSTAPVKLELGAGENRGIPGWTYVDINEECDLSLDLTQPLPLPDNCVDIIYSSHLLEHFKYPDLIDLLRECLRILKPGGIFSSAVPNARWYLEAYHNPANFDPEKFCRYKPAYHYNSKIDFVNYMAYMDGHHHYMFDEENIDIILKNIGFRIVRPREFDSTLDREVRHYETIYVYCEK